MSDEIPEKKTKTQEACEDEILPRAKIIPGIKDPLSDKELYKFMSLDSFLHFINDKENMQRVLGTDTGLRVVVKDRDVEIAIPRKVKVFCEENDLSMDTFVNMAFNFFVDLMVEGRDKVEFRLATRIRNCPFITRENKNKALIWCFQRFKKKQSFLWNIIKKEAEKHGEINREETGSGS